MYIRLTLCCFLSFLLTGFAQERVFFLHIPKSGGITLRSMLLDRYALGSEIEVCNWMQEDMESIIRQIEAKPCIAGHLLYSQVQDAVRNCTKVTVLRNPVDRVLSEHRYCYERDHKNPSKMLQGHFLPPEGDPLETAANVACKFLSRLDPQDLSLPIEAHLTSAKEVLRDEFAFVGITEEMEESVTLFWRLMGWKRPEEIPVHNTTNRVNRGYSLALLQEIAERNWADIELYNFAKELFEQSQRRWDLSLNEQDGSLNRPIQWVDRVEYLFSQPLDGFGWCPRESLPFGTFRWLTTPERGCIDFPLMAQNNYSLEVELCIASRLTSQLRISINEIPLVYTLEPQWRPKGLMRRLAAAFPFMSGVFDVDRSTAEDRWYLCKAVIPRAVLQEGEQTRLEIAIEDAKRPPVVDFYRGRCAARKIAITPIDL